MKSFLTTLTLMSALTLAACTPSASSVPNPFEGAPPAKDGSQKTDAAFSDWQTLVGNYRLKTFGPRDVSGFNIPAEIAVDSSTIRDSASNSAVNMLKLPLFHFVNSDGGSYGQLKLGPLEAKGSFQKVVAGDRTIYTYLFNGPVRYQYMDVTLNLSIVIEESVVQGRTELNVKYSAEIPGHVSPTDREFTLIR
jgi:hypothetical protein